LRFASGFGAVVNRLAVFAVGHGRLGQLALVLGRLDLQTQSEIIGHLPQEVQRRLAALHFDFSPFFDRVARHVQHEILLTAPPTMFEKIMSKHAQLFKRFDKDLVTVMIGENEWSRAMRFCDVGGFDLSSIVDRSALERVEIKHCCRAIAREVEIWKDDGQTSVLGPLASSFIVAELPNWATACLAHARDVERARLLIAGHEKLRRWIQGCVSLYESGPPAGFLMEVLADLGDPENATSPSGADERM
jgi:hypothetical protein